jgi:hypothetical protein
VSSGRLLPLSIIAPNLICLGTQRRNETDDALARGDWGQPDKEWGMRKQYNFRPSSNGLDDWDVDNLIAPSADLPVREVAP